MIASRFLCSVLVLAALAGLSACKKAEPAAEAPAPAPEAAAAAPAEDPAAAPAPAPPVEAEPAPQAAAPAPVTFSPTSASLPGAADVQNALARKDYSGAVVALTRVRASIRQDQLVEYNNLMREVRGAIVDAMATDQNAKRAFDAMRAIVAGR